MSVDLKQREFRVMAHATGWESRSPLYRNHFVARRTHADWATLQALCERGLMVQRRVQDDSVFVVTDAGIAALRGYFNPDNVLDRGELEP